MQIEGANESGSKVHVNNGSMKTTAVTVSEQSSKSITGDAYNINTGDITLTDAVETPLFYFKNDSEDNQIIVPRVFITFLGSTGGPGGFVKAKITKGITGGTILTAADLSSTNFNFGKSKTPKTVLKIGATGLTFTGGSVGPDFLFTSDSQRHLITFEAITLPLGASMTFSLTPPAGNTSLVVQAGANFYISGDPS